MSKCALCSSPARMYCDSDQASLCWSCDSKVHAANFLVARHCRSLLCHICHCPTPWTASGTDFGPTVSVCRRCVAQGAEKIQIGDSCTESETEFETDLKPSFDQEEVGDSDDGDVDLQWSSTPSPPPATSSSSSSTSSSGEECSTDAESPISSLKRPLESSTHLRLQEDLEPWNKRRNTGCTHAVSYSRSRR